MPTSLPPRRTTTRKSSQDLFSTLTVCVLIITCASVVLAAEFQSPGTFDMSIYADAMFGP